MKVSDQKGKLKCDGDWREKVWTAVHESKLTKKFCSLLALEG